MGDWITLASTAVGGGLAIVASGAADRRRRRQEIATRWDTLRIETISEYGRLAKASLTTASPHLSTMARHEASPHYERIRLLCSAQVVGAADEVRRATGTFAQRLATLSADGCDGPTVERDESGAPVTLSAVASAAQAYAYATLNDFYRVARIELGIPDLERDLTIPHPAAPSDAP